MKKTRKKIIENLLYIVVVIAVVIVVWMVAAAVIDSPLILPNLKETGAELVRLLALPEFYRAFLHTLSRATLGFAVSVAIAFFAFFISSLSERAKKLITPFVSILRTLPTMAVSLILLIWVGAKFAPSVLGLLVIAPTIYSSLVARTATVPKELIEVARLNGAKKSKVFAVVIMPTAAAALPETLSSAFSLNIKIVIAAEILMQTAKSLGMLMAQAQAYYMTATLIALVVIAVVVAVLVEIVLNGVLSVLLKRYRD